jgi:hypothetical protein
LPEVLLLISQPPEIHQSRTSVSPRGYRMHGGGEARWGRRRKRIDFAHRKLRQPAIRWWLSDGPRGYESRPSLLSFASRRGEGPGDAAEVGGLAAAGAAIGLQVDHGIRSARRALGRFSALRSPRKSQQRNVAFATGS